jgi:peroxiredoxin
MTGFGVIVEGEEFPDVVLTDHEGDPFRLADHRGRPLVLVLHRHLA